MTDIVNQLRVGARKLVRELGILELEKTPLGQTPKYWHALIEIANQPNITLAALSQLLVLTPSTMTRIIGALVEEGLVKTTLGLDKREKYLAITPKGKSAIKKVDAFSNEKILGAFQFLSESERIGIANALMKYANALERSRQQIEKVTLHTLSTSRVLRKQVINFVSDIQLGEFHIPITKEINAGILKAEHEYYYHHSCNFWYAVDEAGKIVGCIGLKQLDHQRGELKKFFVAETYRGKGVAKRLFDVLVAAAMKHGFKEIYLGTVNVLAAARAFYLKTGFKQIHRDQLPKNFDVCHLDTDFYRLNLERK